MRIFVDVVKLTVEEIKRCWQLGKTADTPKAKSIYMLLVYMNSLFFPVYLIPLLYTFIIAGGAVYLWTGAALGAAF